MQLLKGRMTLKTEFTVIWFFTLHFHYIPAAQGVAAQLKSQHDWKLDAGRSELNGKCVSDGVRNQNGQVVIMYWKILN